MKIMFLGNFRVDYCSEVHYKKTLEKLGHEVIAFQESEVNGVTLQNYIDQNKVDLFFWVHTHGWNTPNIESFLTSCKIYNIPTVGYHLDLWLGIAREKDLFTDPYWRIEHFFSVDPKMVDFLNSTPNMPKAYFLPAGVFEDECYLGDIRPEYQHDIIFVGSRNYHAEWPYRKELIEWLEKTYGNRFAQYGGGGRGVIRGKDLNDLYASAKIVIGDTLCKNFNYAGYLSDRIFETTGRGGFLIHPFIQGVEEHFELFGQDKELITYPFGNFTYLKYLIDYFLQHDSERDGIRSRGFARTTLHHTYTNRLIKLLDTIK